MECYTQCHGHDHRRPDDHHERRTHDETLSVRSIFHSISRSLGIVVVVGVRAVFDRNGSLWAVYDRRYYGRYDRVRRGRTQQNGEVDGAVFAAVLFDGFLWNQR